ncbi:hypothetical protein IFR08_17290 [Pseudomonas fluorescens]|uniref:hypothetical protein n=1 Tax=Pseudomonas fluorescens TaxID=294 RepID=UPI0017853A6F|nr:hypothetical protein [Pseudomonas fluorescens]MBD8099462.1 hypothetical protein [Pseudomonas fluorescens]MBD8775489.1 hypothetical protein [Pseudomonas fluorescens]MBD8782459.1 hypothetical protein [Pseudomonas fluorescens]MBD8794673.1 hypothetical protein [Pseudomonas fluorescens]
MPTINKEPKANVWGPPAFPVNGRFPVDISVVIANYDKQTSEKDLFLPGADKPASNTALQYLPQRLNTTVENTLAEFRSTTAGAGRVNSAMHQEGLRRLIGTIKNMFAADIFCMVPGLSLGKLNS